MNEKRIEYVEHKQDKETRRKFITTREENKKKREDQNAKTRRSAEFLQAVQNAKDSGVKVEATSRQASKFKNGFGAAFLAR